ncbi:MAG: HisA/HisF-related TIM barrel protein, partial [Planctomycetota bacterium]
MHILPAIDLKQDDGGRPRCVRLLQGRADTETAFSDDPAGMARRWADCGARWLHIVDLDGAFSGRPANTDAIRAIRRAVDFDIEVGGGVRDDDSAALLLDQIGVTRVVIGTRGLREPDWLSRLCERHPGRIVGGLDARDGKVAVEGWTRDAGIDAIE